MAQAKQFIKEISTKVRKYNIKGYNGKPGVLFTLGKRIRLRYIEMIGIVNGEVTDLADPAGEPYLVLADKKQGSAFCRFFATNSEDYYDLDRLRIYKESSITKAAYSIANREFDAFADDCFWKTVDKRRSHLTTNFQELSKQVLNEYFNHAFELEEDK